jgi:hypothetical protein
MKLIKQLIFGVRIKGQPILPPSFKTTMPPNMPTEDQWVKKVNFGTRYGHRGSFYN